MEDKINKILIDLKRLVQDVEDVKKEFDKKIEFNDDLRYQKIKTMLESDDWPQAIPDEMIINNTNQEEKLERAENIINLLFDENNIKNINFLDFGCGEGHVVKKMSQYTNEAYGYDIVDNFQSFNNLNLYTSINELKGKKFDIILAFDVIDHVDDPVTVLHEMRNLLKNDGKIYMRCHPWSSRHGGHVYKKINKAFAHLFLNEKEYKKLSDSQVKNKVLFPIKTYREYFEQSQLNVIEEEIHKQELENYFSKNKILRHELNFIFETNGVFPSIQLKQNFVDFILTKKDNHEK